MLRDIAKTQKHVHLTQHNPQVTRADQISSRAIGYGEGDYGAGRYGGVEQEVVDVAPNDFRYVESFVDASLALPEGEMNALGH
jgi:hypothetical protein